MVSNEPSAFITRTSRVVRTSLRTFSFSPATLSSCREQACGESGVIRVPRHVAIGIGCVVGAARVAIGAEWSIAPTFSLTFDDDSNRRLTTEPQASQSALLYTSWLFQHSTDNTQLSLSPWLSWQFFRGDLYTSDDNANLSGVFDWSTERGRLDTSAAVSNESTLFTELTETGILSSDTHRRLAQGTVSWT